MSDIHAQTRAAIDAAAKSHGFQCVPVSWEDSTRSNGPGGLSAYGPNISDVRLYEKTGRLLYTVRSQNWNERLGYVAAQDVAMVTGNEKTVASTLEPCTLRDYLSSVGKFAGYAGVDVPSLFEPTTDAIFSIRFQTVFLPVGDSATAAFGAEPPKTEFCTEVYNYQTHDAANPKNLVLLSTPQGTSVQMDGKGPSRVYFHSVDQSGKVHRYWLEAEKSEKQVGGAQVETLEEATAAALRGKATAVRLGPSSMGTRFNVQMLIQVPLKQKEAPRSRYAFGGGAGGAGGFESAKTTGFGANVAPMAFAAPFSASFGAPCAASAPRRQQDACVARPGVSNAARVSRGTHVDTYAGVANSKPQRDATQHGTITVTMYYTVVGGVPSVADVLRAVQDLDALYKACPSDKRLVNCHEVTSNPDAKPKSLNPFGPPVPVTLPTPLVPAPSVVAPPASGKTPCSCKNGHALAPTYGGEINEPPHGWWCDCCGVFVSPGRAPVAAGVNIPKGFACRPCDFDVCDRCAYGPRCTGGHPLSVVTKAQLGDAPMAPCSKCARSFATHVAVMRGCVNSASCRTLLCQSCFTVVSIAAVM